MTTEATVKGIAATLRYHGDEYHAQAVEALAVERDEARAALAAAERGKAPHCDCGRLATRRWRQAGESVCDRCHAEDATEFAAEGTPIDPADLEDLPHAAAIRAAMGGER